MEQQISDQFSNQPAPQLPKPKTIKPFWIIVLLVLVVALVGVVLWQRNIANKIADSLQQQIVALQDQTSQNGSQQEAQPAGCVKEDQLIMLQESGLVDKNACCSGLIAIKDPRSSKPIPEGGCSGVGSDAYICASCGNGVCGLGENKCNCPVDCEEWNIHSEPSFQFEYPKEMKLSKSGTAGWLIIDLAGFVDTLKYGYRVTKSLHKTNKNLAEYVDSIVNKGLVENCLVGGLPGLKMTSQEGIGLYTDIFTIQDEFVYQISFIGRSDLLPDSTKEKIYQTLDKLTASFKFFQ